jgi:hypothetical protein
MSMLKIILKEAFFREEIDRDPTAGVGNTKYESANIGTFTEDELRMLFPRKVPDPWGDVNAYAVFMIAAVTGTDGLSSVRHSCATIEDRCRFETGYFTLPYS